MKLKNKLAIALSMSVLVCAASYAENTQSNIVHDYNLTEVEKINDEYFLNGEKVDNVITKYIENEPHYYLVTIKDNVLGTETGDNQEYFYFEKDTNGNCIIKNTTEADKAEITGKYSSQNVSERVSNPNSETYPSGINGEFVNLTLTGSNARGAALFNNQNTFEGNINANFINNGINASGGDIYGGAIYNGKYSTESGESILGNITGDFINNYIIGAPVKAYGGAIYSGVGSIGNITGDFIGNHIITTSYESATSIHGGAIATSNSAPVGNITGNFINNYLIAEKDGAAALGGAVYLMSKANKIEGDFLGNYAVASGTNLYGPGGIGGGAIFGSAAEIEGGIKGDFIGNYIINNKYAAQGGAIYAGSTKIGLIEGDFTQNSAITNSDESRASAYGGALAAWGAGGDLTGVKGSFTGNKAISKNNGSAYGGAISNYGIKIGDIEGDFRDNAAQADKNSAYGGAIANMDYSSNKAAINSIKGDFINNTAISNANSTSESTGAFGGAVYNSSSNTFGANFKAKYTQNSAIAENATAAGGAIYNSGTYSGNTDGNHITRFENNTANGKNAYGGAVYNSKNYTDQNVEYINNNVNATSLAQGGAIHSNKGMVTLTNAQVLNNNVSGQTAQGGGLSYKVKSSSGTNGAKLTDVKFENNNVNGDIAQGGAIYNNNGEIHIYSGEFKNNNVTGSTAQGGAIYTTKGNLFIDAKEGDIVFEGNKANGVSNALHTSAGASVTIGASDNHKVIFNDAITSDDDLAAGSRRTLSVNRFSTAGKTGTVEFNNLVSGNHVYAGSGTKGVGTLHLGSYTDKSDGSSNRVHGDFDNGTKLTLAGSNLDMVDEFTDEHTAGELVISTNTNISIDVDYVNSENYSYDYFNVNKLTKSTSSKRLSLKDVNFVGENPTEDVSIELDVIRGLTGVGAVFENFTEMGEWGLISVEDRQNGRVHYTASNSSYNLKRAVDWRNGDRNYTLAKDENVEEDLNALASDKSTLNVEGNGFVIDGNGNKGIEVLNKQTLTLNNTTFKNFANTTANAGAIDNAGTLSLNNTSVIQNTKNGQSHAIHNTGTINLEGNTVIDGAITGNDGYISADGGNIGIKGAISGNTFDLWSGELKINSDTFASSNTTTNFYGGHINFNDGDTKNYEFNYLDTSYVMSPDDVTFGIDINYQDKTADKIIVKNGLGTIVLDKINITDAEAGSEVPILILEDESNQMELVLGENAQKVVDGKNLISSVETDRTTDEIKEKTTWDEEYNEKFKLTETFGDLELTEIRDSGNYSGKYNGINVTVDEVKEQDVVRSLGDTLKLVNNDETHTDKKFTFDAADNIYNVKENLGETKNSLTIKGISNKEKSSTINLDNHSGFELKENSKLNVSDVVLSNAKGQKGSVINANEANTQINLKNTSLINNTSEGEHGGAIYSKSDVNIVTDSGNSTISGNKTSTGNEAIFMGSDTTLTLKSVNKGNISVSDKINGENGYSVNINGDSTGRININNTIDNAKINISNAHLRLANNNNFRTSDVTFNSGTLNLANNVVEQQEMKSLSVNGNMKLNLDADLKNAAMDRLPENTVILNNSKINVDRINLLSDSDKQVTRIPFANNTYKNNVTYIGNPELSKDTQLGSLYSPIYKYAVKYVNKDDMGYFQFTRGAGRSSNDYNPSVLAAPIGAQMGGYLTQLNSYDEAFRNMDMYMLKTRSQRLSGKLANKYAVTETNLPFTVGVKRDDIESGGWFRPYATFESVGLKNGPKVNNTAYGTFAGAESKMYELNDKWDGMFGAYVGYNGSHQSYSGNSIQQNGATVGLVGMLYRDNFFTGLTANFGASIADASTMYGNEDFSMIMSGVAVKTGYNKEFKEGRFIIQPSLTASYSFVNTFNYTNAAGVRISSDPLHAIHVEPGVKFIANFESGWQPYIGISGVWNIMDDTKFSANNVSLPELSVKPYIKYGIGVRKMWGKRFTGYLQAFFTNGGRNGVGLQAGFKWTLGKSCDI